MARAALGGQKVTPDLVPEHYATKASLTGCAIINGIGLIYDAEHDQSNGADSSQGERLVRGSG